MTLVLVIAIPLAAAAFLLIAGARLPRAAIQALGILGPAVSLGAAVAIAQAFAAGKPELVAELGQWLPLRGADLAFRVEPVTVPFMLTLCGIATCVGIAALWDVASEGAQRFFIALNVALAGAVTAAVASDLVILLVAFGLVGAAGASLVGHRRTTAVAARDGAATFVIARAGDAALAVAAAALLALFQTVDIDEIAGRLAVSLLAPQAQSVLAGAGALVLLAATSRAGLAPFAAWLGDTSAGPASATAAAHGLVMSSGAILILRLAAVVHPDVLLIAGAIGAATAMLASAAALTGRARIESWRTSAAFGAAFAALSVSAFAGSVVLVAAMLARASAILAGESRAGRLPAGTALILALAAALTFERPAIAIALLVATALAAAGVIADARSPRGRWRLPRFDHVILPLAAGLAAAVYMFLAVTGTISAGAPRPRIEASAFVLPIVAIAVGALLGALRVSVPPRAARLAGEAVRLDGFATSIERSFDSTGSIVERGGERTLDTLSAAIAGLLQRGSRAARRIGEGPEWAHEALFVAAAAAIVIFWMSQ